MAKHHIKSWAHFYDAIAEGRKLHDLRKMDREYNIGDILVLERYDNINGNYTGEQQEVEITYITSNRTPCAFSSSALDRDYAILSLKLLKNNLVQSEIFYRTDGRPTIVNKLPNGGPVNPNISYICGERLSEIAINSPKYEEIGQNL